MPQVWEPPALTESKATLDAFSDAIHQIVTEDSEFLHEAPHEMSISRPDDVTAARQPVLKWAVQTADESV